MRSDEIDWLSDDDYRGENCKDRSSNKILKSIMYLTIICIVGFYFNYN